MKILRPAEVTCFPEPRELSPEEQAQAYTLARAAFSADDLQRYTETLEGVPAEDVLRELEETQRQLEQRPQ
jgi:hypothetical protein